MVVQIQLKWQGSQYGETNWHKKEGLSTGDKAVRMIIITMFDSGKMAISLTEMSREGQFGCINLYQSGLNQRSRIWICTRCILRRDLLQGIVDLCDSGGRWGTSEIRKADPEKGSLELSGTGGSCGISLSRKPYFCSSTPTNWLNWAHPD